MKQVPRAWYEKIDHLFINLGFKHYESNHNIYVLHVHGDTLIIAIYVDDLVITGNNLDLIVGLKRQLVETFEMIDLGLLHFFLGLQVLPMYNGFFLSQSKYVLDLLRRLNLDDYKLHSTPFQSGVKLTKECTSPKVDLPFINSWTIALFI